VLTVLAITVLGVLGTMTVFIYAVPLLGATAGLGGLVLSLVLLAYGAGGMVGNAVGGRCADRFGPARTLLVATVGVVVVMATLSLTATTAVGAALAFFVWGATAWSFNPPLQSILLELSPAGGLLLSLNASAIYFGSGLSGIVGGVVIGLTGAAALPVVGAGLSVVVLLLTVVLRWLVGGRLARSL
ncbi:MAG: MFS transporter, partial [Pseudonocardia sp.]|nr:MFS transporter [Pseudonocardia sp.]